VAVFAVATLLMLEIVSASAETPRYYDYFKPATHPDSLLGSVNTRHLAYGIQMMNKGEYARAAQDAQYILDYFPNHPGGLAFVTDLAFKVHKPALAQDYLDKALARFPDNASTYDVYGVFYHRLGKYRQAVDAYKKAIELDPAPAETHYHLALAYLAMNELESANREAQLAYAAGYQLPALRDKLKARGAWKPLFQETTGEPPSAPEAGPGKHRGSVAGSPQ
jgi:tetratricopeptide (TPR) repeat protein